MVNPLDRLFQQNQGALDLNDPDALARLIADTPRSEGGAVPDDVQEDSSPDPWVNDDLPQQSQSPQQPQQQTQGGGQWGSWLQEPSNRSFLLNFGLQLMSGGWGGWSENLARAIAAGAQGAHATEAGVPLGQGGGGRGRRTVVPDGRRTGRPRSGRGLAPEAEQHRQQELQRLQQLQTFLIRQDITEAEWNREATEGGLIHQAFGPMQPFSKKNDLLTQVQARQRRLLQLPRRGGTITSDELRTLGESDDPNDQMEFQIFSRQLLGSPGPGRTWRFDRSTGRVVPSDAPPGARGGRGSGRFEAAQLAGVDQSRLTIGNLREFISSPEHYGMFARMLQQGTRVGPYARLLNSMQDAVFSYMYARSGATVSVRELESYLQGKMPQATDSQASILYKLADLELAIQLIARRNGETVSDEQLLQSYNELRKHTGMGEISIEQFRALLPRLLSQSGLPDSGLTAPSTQTPQTPPQQPPQTAPTAPPGAAPSAPAPSVRPPWASEPPQGTPRPPGLPQNYFWDNNLGTWRRAD